MGMRLGYACINTELPSPSRTTRLANATPERLRELISANLDALEAIVHWNAAHGIQVFRLTSDLIPFASHPVNALAWWDEFGERLGEIGGLFAATGARVPMHPGQYTVLASEQPVVVDRALAELEYHARLLRSLGLDRSHKMVIHVGSGHADPPATAARFASAYGRLSDAARERLVLEHDERWSLEQALELAEPIAVPVVFDAFHHQLRPSLEGLDVRAAALRAASTWAAVDGRPEVHFSTQQPGKRPGAHAEQLDLDAFRSFEDAVGDLPLDCTLEVKDKQRSVLRALS